jgi:hypothetical protein
MLLAAVGVVFAVVALAPQRQPRGTSERAALAKADEPTPRKEGRMDRRILTVATLTLLLVALAASPASAQATTVTYTGPVEAGTFLELTCPEGTLVQYTQGSTQISASASFFRNARMTAKVAVNLTPTGAGPVSVGWTVPRGARYATATLTCEPPPVVMDASGTLDAAGQEAQVLCPADTPYVWSASPIVFESTDGNAYPLSETRIYDEAGRWVGVSFTAPEAGSWSVTLDCQWRPYE